FRVPIGGGRLTIPVDPWRPCWPILIDGSGQQVVCVLEDWVEDNPDPSLAEEFKAVPAWRSAVAEYSSRERPLLEWIPPPCSARKYVESVRRNLRNEILLKHGFVPTPGTIRYLEACRDPNGPALPMHGPTRGVRVTSVALAPAKMAER